MKKVVALFLSVLMIAAMLPLNAFALSDADTNTFDISEGDVIIADDGDNIKVTYGDSQEKTGISQDDTITIIGITNNNNIVVNVTNKAKIKIDSINIDHSQASDGVNDSPFDIQKGDVTLLLNGDSNIEGIKTVGTGGNGTINLENDTKLTIKEASEGATLTLNSNRKQVCYQNEYNICLGHYEQYVDTTSQLYVESGTINANSGPVDSNNFSYAVSVGDLNMTGGNLNIKSAARVGSMGIWAQKSAYIKNSTITANSYWHDADYAQNYIFMYGIQTKNCDIINSTLNLTSGQGNRRSFPLWIASDGYLNVDNSDITATGENCVIDGSSEALNAGIYADTNTSVTIKNGSNVNLDAVKASGGTWSGGPVKCYGIYFGNSTKEFSVKDSTLVAHAGTASGSSCTSCGIYTVNADNPLKITNSHVTAYSTSYSNTVEALSSAPTIDMEVYGYKTNQYGNYSYQPSFPYQYSASQKYFEVQPAYRVDFVENGGSTTLPTGAIKNGLVTAPTEPTKDNYDFAGWYKESGLLNLWAFDTDIAKSNMTLYADWSPKYYSVDYDLDNGIQEEGAPNSYLYGVGLSTLPTPTRENYTFNGWSDGLSKVTSISPSESGDVTLIAMWTPKNYNIIYNLSGGTQGNNAPTEYTYSTGIATLPTPTKTGCSFAGWYIGDTKVTSITTTDSGEKTLTAKWTGKTYQITYDLDNGTQEKGAATTYTFGNGIIKLPTPTKDNYIFEGWYNGNNKVTSISATTVGDITLTAKWKENPGEKTTQVISDNDVSASDFKNIFDNENLVSDDKKGITSEDLSDNKSVDIKVTITDKNKDNAQKADEIIKASNGKKIGLFFDISVEKTVSKNKVEISKTKLTEVPELITFNIPLSKELQNKAEYSVFRNHEDKIDEITSVPNEYGECIKLINNGTELQLKARRFSTYAIGFKDKAPVSDNNQDKTESGKVKNPKTGAGMPLAVLFATGTCSALLVKCKKSRKIK